MRTKISSIQNAGCASLFDKRPSGPAGERFCKTERDCRETPDTLASADGGSSRLCVRGPNPRNPQRGAHPCLVDSITILRRLFVKCMGANSGFSELHHNAVGSIPREMFGRNLCTFSGAREPGTEQDCQESSAVPEASKVSHELQSWPGLPCDSGPKWERKEKIQRADPVGHLWVGSG